ncbi:unnamed protein product [Darwinula stevensoni]|uniref:Sulfotransferase n=1 Tax=Darwinula stevensoni TaxID=69355 RepID=A0A7R8XK18_9CRUS|nr:unnamed protein product [Darwinula stevensoni]CAG0895880.1 unnamed protein product [Darwinula stevensoni]
MFCDEEHDGDFLPLRRGASQMKTFKGLRIATLDVSPRYYFEPLFLANEALKKELLKQFSRLSLYLLDSLYNCNTLAVNALLPLSPRNKGYFSHPPCNDSNVLHVAKVISFKLDPDALAWLRSRKDIKVVHWLRDPRGIINSRLQTLHSDFQRDPWMLCDQIGHDILAIDSLPPNRRRRVSYEEFMSNPIEITRDLYRFLGIPWPSDGDKRVLAYFAEPSSKHHSKDMNSTMFDPYHWKRDMKEEVIVTIERECGAVMDALGYQRLEATGSQGVEEVRVENLIENLQKSSQHSNDENEYVLGFHQWHR